MTTARPPDAPLLTLAEARQRRLRVGFRPSDISKPAFLGRRTVEVSLDELLPLANLDELDAEQRALLEVITREKLLRARGVYGFWAALSIGDDVVLYRAESLREEVARFPMLRQQVDRGADAPTTSLADFVAPKQSGLTDYVGAFALTTGLGLEELAATHDAGRASVLADRLAEAFAELLHARVRREFGHELDPRDSAQRGIRIPCGSEAWPDLAARSTLFTLLGAREIGMDLTDQLAIKPTASAAGLYLAHPKAHDFDVGPLAKDQIEDYAPRRGTTVREVERWLQSNLAYGPD